MLKFFTNDSDYGIEAYNHPLPKNAQEKVGNGYTSIFYTKAQPRFLQDTETDKANLFLY